MVVAAMIGGWFPPPIIWRDLALEGHSQDKKKYLNFCFFVVSLQGLFSRDTFTNHSDELRPSREGRRIKPLQVFFVQYDQIVHLVNLLPAVIVPECNNHQIDVFLIQLQHAYARAPLACCHFVQRASSSL